MSQEVVIDLEKPQHLRELLGITEEYVGYCREERNFAAVLYHLLLDENQLKSFLDLIGQDVAAVKLEDVRIYFEYAHLRDLWAEAACGQTVAEKNERYRAAIISMLRMPEGLELPSIDKVIRKDVRTGKDLHSDDCTAFNAFFGASSANHIQMPSRWSDSQFNMWSEFGRPFRKQFGGQTFPEHTFAQRACSLKWAFNAKPDLVLHLGDNRAICIEAKLESAVGSYQVKLDSDPEGPFNMKQLKLQEFILKDLLGYDTEFVVISKERNWEAGKPRKPWSSYSWHEVYSALTQDYPAMAERFSMVTAFRGSKLIKP